MTQRLLPIVWIAAAVPLLSACVSYKPVQSLGEDERAELAGLSSRLADERIRVVPVDEHAARDAGDLAAALRHAGATVSDESPTLTLRADHRRHTLDEPMLMVLTLGLLPHYSAGWSEYRWWLVGDGGEETSGEAESTAPSWVGWLVAPIALLPGWQLTATWRDDSPETGDAPDARRERLALALARSITQLRDAE